MFRILTFGIGYKVASLFYKIPDCQTNNPESLKSIGQF